MNRFVVNSILFVLFFTAIIFQNSLAQAQTPTPMLTPKKTSFDFYSRGPYREDIPRPSKILGYEPGEFNTNYANFERVLREYSTKSNRLKVIERGQTPGRHQMYLLVISSPENLSKLDLIKSNVSKLADPRTIKDSTEAEKIIKETPAVVWLNYSIHGDEAAGFEAGILVLYQLIASEDRKLVETLQKTVILINPAQNPDGHERFATWYNGVGIGRSENFAYEHTEPWSIYGRLNHYFFDLNRDLLVSSQVESQSSMKAFLEWHPQVSADHHGQTTQFFFPPAALPINKILPRETTQKWMEIFGQANSKAFDFYGWHYYSRDNFDLFYPGYWDSWPSLNGAIGMTYETDGGGDSASLNWKRDDDTIVTLRDGIAKHVTASLTTIETSALNREARLRDYYTFFKDAISEGENDKIKSFIIPPGKDPGRTAQLIAILLRNGIEIQRANEKISAKIVSDYFGNNFTEKEFEAGSYFISLAQPQFRIINAFLEADPQIDKEFLERQFEKRKRNEQHGEKSPKNEYEFYDITAWALPLTHGVEAYWSEKNFTVKADRVLSVDETKWMTKSSSISPATTAYVFTPETEAGEHLALQLLKEGYKIAAALKPLHAGGKNYVRGTFVVRVERNPESLHERITSLAEKYGVVVNSINTAYIDSGITGVGSESVQTLKPPKIAIIADDMVAQTSYGSMRFVLSRDFEVEFVPITINTFKKIRMTDFNVLILPDGNSSEYLESFGKTGIEKLKNWCDQGGVLICIGGAASFAANKEANLTSVRLVGSEKETGSTPTPIANSNPFDPKNIETPQTKSEELPKTEEKKKPISVPGAICRAKLNREHFLTFGYEQDEIPVLINGADFFQKTKMGTNILTFANENLRLSGFTWEKNTEELLKETANIIDEPLGAGHILLYASDPNFRYIWHASTRLFLNGIIYAPTISGVSTGIR